MVEKLINNNKKMKRLSNNRYIVLSLLLLSTLFCYAQNASFSVQAPHQVIKGNKFQVTYILRNAEGSGLKTSEIGGATKLYGPSTSTSYSQQWINGVSSSSSSQEYTIVYRADKVGKYNVAGATIIVNGKTIKCNGFTLEILPPDKTASNSSNQSQSVQIDNINSQASSKNVNAKDLFVRIILSKPSVYEQEATVCTIKLYTKYQISQFMATLQPSFNGFLIEDLPITAQLNSIENVNGENYMVAELKRCILYPQQSGKLTITSGNYDLTVIQYEEHRSMFGIIRQPVEKQLKVKSNQGSVNVMALPQPKPASFNGAVGDFKISSKLNTNKFKTNEAATFSFNISGTGNIKYVKSPIVNFPSQFEVYDPQSTVNATPSGSNMSGTTKWEYTFIPQFVGEFTIPESHFTYFNPASKKYITLTTEAYKFKVAKGANVATSTDKKNIIQKNTDILHIKTGDLNLNKDFKFIISSPIYWLLYILPIAILISIMIMYRKTLKARSNIQLMKNKKAGKIAKKRLKLAKSYMIQHESSKFYNESLKAIWGYLSDKLGIPVSNLNKENIANELEKYGASKELISSILDTLNECEFAQYAPEQTDAKMESIYSTISDIMDKLESTKKL
ncbi:MAG: BatD family protein [Muribaculaceae bacterium]|nr:BatD family protein [Muribaculaceae bacterium]